jgi:hypothetical protein
VQAIFAFAETSPAAASTVASSQPVTGTGANGAAGVLQTSLDLESFDALTIYASLIGATGGTLDVYLQTSIDEGTTWDDYAHFTQLAAGAGAIKYKFAVSRAGQLLVPVAVGINLTPALAAGSVVGGEWGDRMRLVMVAGASTTAGAAVSVKISASRALAT